jgi:rfaE bifunctional protein nucleotidyltransferase chain/domain
VSLPANPRLLAPADLAARLAQNPPGRVVFTNGCFDLLHPGHVDLLTRCRELGDALVVALNTDESVRRIKGGLPGPPRPLNTLEARAFVLAGLACVDHVTFFGEDTPLEVITRLAPDVLVKGGDWPVSAIVGRDVVEARGGKVVSLPLLAGYSTTGLIDRIMASCG